MLRPTALLLLLCPLFACQCFEPVAPSPRKDGGALADGGRAECSSKADCTAKDAGSPFCTTRSASCVAGRCVTECSSPGRSCELVDAGRCLDCQENTSDRVCTLCARSRVCTFTVESAGCPAPFAQGARFTVGASAAGCGGPIRPEDGGAALGTWDDLAAGQALVSLPSLGGTCLSTTLATGAPRAAIACPACTLVEMGCE